jgi:hypothetical protein
VVAVHLLPLAILIAIRVPLAALAVAARSVVLLRVVLALQDKAQVEAVLQVTVVVTLEAAEAVSLAEGKLLPAVVQEVEAVLA